MKRYRALVKLFPKQTSKINIRLQENIAKAAIGYQQIISNVMSFKASGLIYLDSPISASDNTTPR